MALDAPRHTGGPSWVERAENIRPRTAFLTGALFTASPGVQSARVLERMKAWLGAHGQRVVAGVLGVAGTYLTYSGIAQLLS